MPDKGSRLDRIEATLERIAERHAALAQTVELLAGMQRENEQRFARTEDRFARNEERLAQLMDAMNRLIRIVENHERRLDNLEGA